MMMIIKYIHTLPTPPRKQIIYVCIYIYIYIYIHACMLDHPLASVSPLQYIYVYTT